MTSFFLFLYPAPHTPPPTFSGLAAPRWELLCLPSSWDLALGLSEDDFLDTQASVSLGPRAQPRPQLPPPGPLPSTGFGPMFGLLWPRPGSKKELFLSPCIVLSPIPKMGSGLGGGRSSPPPAPGEEGGRENLAEL